MLNVNNFNIYEQEKMLYNLRAWYFQHWYLIVFSF